jgi:hypothetical protein
LSVFNNNNIFNILNTNRLKVEKLEAMAKLHTHYIVNAEKELKFAYTGLSEDAFQSSVQQALSSIKASDGLDEDDDDDDDDYFFDSDDSDDSDDDYDNDDSNNSDTSDTRNTEIEKWINIDDSELKKLLSVNVSVVIEPHPITIDHGSKEFDVEATLDNILGTNTS